jgi:hypothetical protein
MEWVAVHFITGFLSPFALFLHSNSTLSNPYLLYLCVISILISLIAAAKSGLYNVFRAIRQTPKFIMKEIRFQLEDYRYWKLNGERIDQSKRSDRH